jgi:hypothetical protein
VGPSVQVKSISWPAMRSGLRSSAMDHPACRIRPAATMRAGNIPTTPSCARCRWGSRPWIRDRKSSSSRARCRRATRSTCRPLPRASDRARVVPRASGNRRRCARLRLPSSPCRFRGASNPWTISSGAWAMA